MYGAVANESARITELQLKAAELAIKRVIQKNGVL
jgi:ribosomal protein L16/L10AE